MDVEEAHAKYKLALLSSDDLVQLADSWLGQGIYSDALNELCSIKHPQGWEPIQLFERAMVELQEIEPTKLEAAHTIFKNTLRRVVSKEINAGEAVGYLYSSVYSEVADIFRDEIKPGLELGLWEIFCLGVQYSDISPDSQWYDKDHLEKLESEIRERSILWLQKT